MPTRPDSPPRHPPLSTWIIALSVAPLIVLASAGWLGLVVYRLALPRVHDGFWAFAAAVGIPLAFLGGLWLLQESWRRHRDRQALRRLENGAPRRAGGWVAVTGMARPAAEVFAAPLSGRPALACRYRVMERAYRDEATAHRRRSSAFALRLEGYRLVPAVIESRTERVRLGGLPELRNMEDRDLGSGPAEVADAVAGPGWPARIVVRAQLFLRPADQVHADWSYGEVKTPARTWRLEWILPPDAEVCAAGRWSPDGALLPHWSRSSGIPVYAGSPATVAAALGTEIRVYAFLSASLLIPAAATMVWLMSS
jgi:hypothetical protein